MFLYNNRFCAKNRSLAKCFFLKIYRLLEIIYERLNNVKTKTNYIFEFNELIYNNICILINQIYIYWDPIDPHWNPTIIQYQFLYDFFAKILKYISFHVVYVILSMKLFYFHLFKKKVSLCWQKTKWKTLRLTYSSANLYTHGQCLPMFLV